MCRASYVVIALLASSCAAPRPATSSTRVDEWGTPQIELRASSGWGGPPIAVAFRLYSSGRVLYADAHDRQDQGYQWVALTPAERDELVRDLPLDRVGRVELPKRVGDDGGTDCIYVWSDGVERTSCLWGGFVPIGPGDGDDAPPELRLIWERLTRFSSPRARVWIPERIDVVAEPWRWRQPEDKCGKPAAWRWPSTWPEPGGRGVQMPVWGWKFSLPPSELPTLRRIAAARTAKGCAQPLELRGEPWAIAFGAALP